MGREQETTRSSSYLIACRSPKYSRFAIRSIYAISETKSILFQTAICWRL